MRSVTCAPTRLVWSVCRFKTRDFAIVLPLLSWHDTVSVRRPIISIEEIKKNFFFSTACESPCFDSDLFFFFFIPKILEYIRSTSTRIGGGEERKEGKIRVVAQKTTNPFGGSSFECAETSESLQRMTARSRYGSHFCCVWFNFS